MGKNHPNVDDYVVSRVRALESLLLEKGILPPDAVDRVIRRYETSTGPMIGARAVARAWRDPAYKRRLLEDSPAALADLGVNYDRLVVMENTPAVHNLVVCTLCSCYPWDVMGLPPTWYKMPAYRSRAVSEPRDGAGGVRRRHSARARGARVGQLGRAALHGASPAARRRRAARRGGPGAPHHARGADRRGRSATAMLGLTA